MISSDCLNGTNSFSFDGFYPLPLINLIAHKLNHWESGFFGEKKMNFKSEKVFGSLNWINWNQVYYKNPLSLEWYIQYDLKRLRTDTTCIWDLYLLLHIDDESCQFFM